MRAKELYKMLRAESKRPIRSHRELARTSSYRMLSEACGLDVDGNPIRDAKRQLRLSDFSLRDLFENLVVNRDTGEPVGREFVRECLDPRFGPRDISEDIAAVSTTQFTGITGQLLVAEVLSAYQSEEFVATAMVPTRSSPFEQEKIPGIAKPENPGRSAMRVNEGQSYPMFGFGEQYVETPMTEKTGGIIGLTREAIFFDRTGMVVEVAQQVGQLSGQEKEIEIIDGMIGGTTVDGTPGDQVYFVEKRQFDSAKVTLDLFQRASATAGAYQLSYAHSTRKYPFVNDVTANPITDYTNIRASDKQFDLTVDPNTGLPIIIGNNPIVFACATRKADLARLANSTQVLQLSQSGTDAAGAIMTFSPNPVAGDFGPSSYRTSRLLRSRIVTRLYGGTDDGTAADKVWFRGNPSQAFRYLENWGTTVTQATTNSEAEFNQDIVMRFKVSRRGRIAIREARAWQRNNFISQS